MNLNMREGYIAVKPYDSPKSLNDEESIFKKPMSKENLGIVEASDDPEVSVGSMIYFLDGYKTMKVDTGVTLLIMKGDNIPVIINN